MNRVDTIVSVSAEASNRSKYRWDHIAKPLNSFGLLERMITEIAAITGSSDFILDKRAAVVMCADNGVVCEKVTQSEQDVTAKVAEAMVAGNSNISNICKTFNIDVFSFDAGMANSVDGITDISVKRGTDNIKVGPAMSEEAAKLMITRGIDAVKELSEKGYKIIITGEMGIGNTTTSSAIAACILNMPVKAVTGKGAGLTADGIIHKAAVIEEALQVNKLSICDDYTNKDKAIELLAKVGGFDIAALTGVFLGGAIYHVPVVVDGIISEVAASLAVCINERARDYMLLSHISKEPAGVMLTKFIGKKSIIDGELCLGEGTGAALLIPLLDGALSLYNSTHSFESLDMEEYKALS